MEISRKQAEKIKADGMGYEFSNMSGQDYLMVASHIFTIKDDLDADEKAEKAQIKAEDL